jgi:hypothetical protein
VQEPGAGFDGHRRRLHQLSTVWNRPPQVYSRRSAGAPQRGGNPRRSRARAVSTAVAARMIAAMGSGQVVEMAHLGTASVGLTV